MVDALLVVLLAGATSDVALFAHGLGFGTVNVSEFDRVDGQPANNASTNHEIEPAGTSALSDVAPSVVPKSCAAPPSTLIQSR